VFSTGPLLSAAPAPLAAKACQLDFTPSLIVTFSGWASGEGNKIEIEIYYVSVWLFQGVKLTSEQQSIFKLFTLISTYPFLFN
jgi:hypothetical protein